MPYISRVPWVSMEEWKDVKRKFCSSDCQDWVRAFQLMLMWKARGSKLPANVECSLGIIQVLIQKTATETTSLNMGKVLFSDENDLQLSFSTAIVRFVNHIMIPSKSSFYTAASEQNIPDWVVNLRHDVSHSASLPPLALLESAVNVARQWLIDNYWTPQELEMTPVDGSALCEKTTPVTTPQTDEAVESGLSCWLICQKRLEADINAKVSDLSPSEFKSLIGFKQFLESKLLLKGIRPFLRIMESATQNQTGKRVPLQRLADSLHRFLLTVTKRKTVVTNIVQWILNAGILRSGGKDFELWSPVLKILHGIDSMELFLEKVFEKLATGTDGERRSANDWLLVLLPLFESVQSRWRAHRLGSSIDNCNETHLQLSIRKPPRLRYEIFRKALINLDPISSSSDVASRYAKFIRPKIGKEARSSMTNLVNLYTNTSIPNSDSMENYTMYSIEDLITPEPETDQIVPESVEDSIWTEVDIDVEEWHKCPIGLLPHQKEPNLTLPDLVWVKVSPQRKRKSPEDYFGWDE